METLKSVDNGQSHTIVYQFGSHPLCSRPRSYEIWLINVINLQADPT